MSRLSGGSIPSAHAELYESTAEFLKAAANPTSLALHAVAFRKRAIDGAGKTVDLETLLDPTLVQKRHAEHKRQFRDVKHKFIEQEAKRAFLHAITGEAPETVRDGEQEELAKQNKVKKARLKATKEEIAEMYAQALDLGKKSAAEHNRLAEETAEVAALHKSITDMELELARLKSTYPPDKRLTTSEADARLEAQQEELERLTADIASADACGAELRSDLSRRNKEVARLQRDREREEARAAEVRRQREAGGAGVRAHELGRWYAVSLAAYRSLMGIKSARAVSKNGLEIEYVDGATLRLYFDAGGRFEDASLKGHDMDLAELVQEARERNDPARLVSAVLAHLRPL
ncbi:hypothetical protein CcaverHIS002_0408430 [Cutaneotrichosporon cavernicola]|uniref:Kinetochore protein Sos7 coiled-coil domain-containing protein n=1 Tax=Cutaneotrichosporon cavernicola TaxID=279322 RepID=A0AA48L4Y8_9TREE|nr:uncharacterized protein CcaverHIS019_0408370 [Cutaneotrichosporon cavernicola]BEI84239.1 hypothetical protein CcaverHIS002_0408430 [Cutaneotrichosporon cavernicola]BEI92017.1 hypothetical protein CcaverHIS019_0408370 [Cutaneotrichosporon cavernicola]BEI99787.1 hypothetical protein CcaverHIS631_0408300 [Cutaneotrichosporon cavernicola]BEJ07563.1 hypothetical protein CcaverHIS641_0408320 [Cutaneotrichosporon cavernicola]